MEEEKKCISGRDYFNNDHLHDIILKFGRHEIKAHKVVLSSNSQYFRKLFSLNARVREQSQSVVTLEDDHELALLIALRHCYGYTYDDQLHGDRDIDIDNILECFELAVEVHQIADKYDMPSVRQEALEAIDHELFGITRDIVYFVDALDFISKREPRPEVKTSFAKNFVRYGGGWHKCPSPGHFEENIKILAESDCLLWDLTNLCEETQTLEDMIVNFKPYWDFFEPLPDILAHIIEPASFNELPLGQTAHYLARSEHLGDLMHEEPSGRQLGVQILKDCAMAIEKRDGDLH